MTTLETILELERRVWDALSRGDALADAACLHEDFVGVYSTGFSNREQHAAQLKAGPIVQSYEISQAQIMIIQQDLVMLIYRADFFRPDFANALECMYVSSLWRHYPTGWLNIFSQDTGAA